MGSSYIANIIKTRRKELNMSVRDVITRLQAFDINISEKTLYGWENGHRQPDADTFIVLCNIYGIETLTGIKHITPETHQPSHMSDEAIQIAGAFDIADDRDKNIVRTTLQPYMEAPAAKESPAQLA